MTKGRRGEGKGGGAHHRGWGRGEVYIHKRLSGKKPALGQTAALKKKTADSGEEQNWGLENALGG